MACAAYDLKYALIRAAVNTTDNLLKEVKTYTTLLNEKLVYYKSNCQKDISFTKIQTCSDTLYYIEHRLKFIEERLFYIEKYVKEYPAELQGARANVERTVTTNREKLVSLRSKVSLASKKFKEKADDFFYIRTRKKYGRRFFSR